MFLTRVVRRAIEPERLGGRNDPDQAVEVVAVRCEIVGQEEEGRVELAGGG
jgi:hypothetical protein